MSKKIELICNCGKIYNNLAEGDYPKNVIAISCNCCPNCETGDEEYVEKHIYNKTELDKINPHRDVTKDQLDLFTGLTFEWMQTKAFKYYYMNTKKVKSG